MLGTQDLVIGLVIGLFLFVDTSTGRGRIGGTNHPLERYPR